MNGYILVLRAKPGIWYRIEAWLRLVVAIVPGVGSGVGRSVLDVEDRVSGQVIARWEAPLPAVAGSETWLPLLETELDTVGLDAFCEKYDLVRYPDDRSEPA